MIGLQVTIWKYFLHIIKQTLSVNLTAHNKLYVTDFMSRFFFEHYSKTLAKMPALDQSFNNKINNIGALMPSRLPHTVSHYIKTILICTSEIVVYIYFYRFDNQTDKNSYTDYNLSTLARTIFAKKDLGNYLFYTWKSLLCKFLEDVPSPRHFVYRSFHASVFLSDNSLQSFPAMRRPHLPLRNYVTSWSRVKCPGTDSVI